MRPRSPAVPRPACAAALVALLAGCAGSYDGGDLTPGRSTGEEVVKAMAPLAEKRAGANGETVLWFPRLPYGRVSYAARIGQDDRLVAVEQRLTREYLDLLKPGISRESDVRDVLGPPNRIDRFARQGRDSWSYQAHGIEPQLIIVQLSMDGVVREAFMMNDPMYSMDGSE